MTDDTTPSTDESAIADDSGRTIELEVTVPGTPDEVWRAIATGPGISSWYVPHTVEEREGGSIEFTFGPGMDASGRVAVWDPPRRVVFDGGDITGLAFEWLVEAQDSGSCVVRLVNSGFGSGDEWDDQYDAMRDGWQIFLTNLRLHLEHFAGQSATASLPMATWEGTEAGCWDRLLADLGLPSRLEEGDRIGTVGDAPRLSGTVARVGVHEVALVVDEPAAGTAFFAAEAVGGAVSVSVWSYLYGDDGAAAVARDQPAWAEWLGSRGTGESRGS